MPLMMPLQHPEMAPAAPWRLVTQYVKQKMQSTTPGWSPLTNDGVETVPNGGTNTRQAAAAVGRTASSQDFARQDNFSTTQHQPLNLATPHISKAHMADPAASKLSCRHPGRLPPQRPTLLDSRSTLANSYLATAPMVAVERPHGLGSSSKGFDQDMSGFRHS